MPRITGDIVIEQPVADVFAFVADARNEPSCNHQMLRVRTLTSGPVGVGSRFAAVHRGRRRPMELQTELTEYQRPRRLVLDHHDAPSAHQRRAHLRTGGLSDPDALGLGAAPDWAREKWPHHWSRQSVRGRNEPAGKV